MYSFTKYNNIMAKRDTTLGIKKKSTRSPKTAKRLAAKKVMLATKAANRRTIKSDR
jgi:hypothetical protein